MKKYDNFCKALANLQDGMELEPPYTPVEETGILGLFGICFELSWKLMKVLLEQHGRLVERIGSPKAVLGVAYQCGMIDGEETWLELLETRNRLAHTYSSDEVPGVIAAIRDRYLPAFEALKSEIDAHWLSGTPT